MLGRVHRIAARRRPSYLLISLLAALPRLVALVADRGDILLPFTFGEKSDDIARTFVDTGTFGFIPGLPTAYTQPLYSFVLIPLYATVGRSWEVVGGTQILVAVATAVVVYEIGRRWLPSPAGLVAAGLTTLHPYLVWHDVHVNREILDGLLAAAIMLLTLALAARRSLPVAAVLGVVLGLAILGNVRLTPLPLLLGGFLLWQWRPSRAAATALAVTFASAAIVVLPWLVRNDAQVGCFALTTDSRGLWEANNERTLATLRAGLWIDNVPLPAGFPPSAQDAGREYRRHGRIVRVDECRQAAFYRERVLDFWRDHPGEKAKLAGQATLMLWNPAVSQDDRREGAASWLNTVRRWLEPTYMLPLYLLAALGLTRVPRVVAALSVLLLGYQWLIAMVFVGATRYRVPWDFVLALLAAAAVVDLAERLSRRGRSRPA
jgi:hypothetical protein